MRRYSSLPGVYWEEYALRYVEAFPGHGRHIPGQILTMCDGSRWFHAYEGGAPVKL